MIPIKADTIDLPFGGIAGKQAQRLPLSGLVAVQSPTLYHPAIFPILFVDALDSDDR
jgi:hypothetical protein